MASIRNSLATVSTFSVLAVGAAHADVLTVGAGWDPFHWVNAVNDDGSLSPDGGPFLDANYVPELFTFTTTSYTDFNITDSYYTGDQFLVLVLGPTSFFTATSTPGPNTGYGVFGDDAVTDFDLAFADPNFSHGSYSLAPGAYTVFGDVFQSPYGYGTGAVELAVPEPASWAMMLLGFGVLGGMARRRASRGAVAT